MRFISITKRLILAVVLLCAVFSLPVFAQPGQRKPAFEKFANGITLELAKQQPTDAEWMKITVCNENILHVIAAPGDAFSSRASLMVERTGWPAVNWSAVQKGNHVEISTSSLKARINCTTGAISFHDAKGKLLLKEKMPGGKIISPAEVLGEKTFHVQQIFASPADEAFYGLGGHQNDVMNYKGHDVDLQQMNIVDVVPFLVSSKNYGILWDNYSRTKFGDIRDYQSLASLKTCSKLGQEGGLTVEYFNDQNFSAPLLTQQEKEIAHDFIDQPGIYPQGFNLNRGSIRWSGEIASTESGVHKFRLYSSSFVKMWLNGELVVDAWRQNWLPWTHLLRLPMEAGKRYAIKIEWIPSGGSIGLKYLTPDRADYANTLSLYSDVGDQIDYYFIKGNKLDEVIAGYREVTGAVPMMPKWSMGFWQCRERYQTRDELVGVVKEYRKRQIPLDNIVQDWQYWPEDQWGSHEFDLKRFPDPDGMVKELHEDLHANIMISVWPKFYEGIEHYKEFEEKGWLHMHNIKLKKRDWVGPGYISTFFDSFSADARELYWQQMNEHLFSKGFDAWWLDSVEPDLESNISDQECLIRVNPNALGTAARYQNAYSLVLTKGVYEKQRQTRPDQRVFILTRSAYAGQQRYAAATWSGDVATRWYDLKAQIPAGLNFSLSGIPWWTTDIGGFAVEPRFERNVKEADLEEWRELNTRWFQMAAFLPLFRSHGQFPYREMYNLAPEDHPAFQTMVAYDKLRYRLMPYIYSLAGMVTQNHYTVMRALVMDFGHDKKVHDIGDQYLFGPAILVNPVVTYKAQVRPVYLPKGCGWYDLKTGRYNQGGQTIQADAPYTDMPLYVRAGSIIPCGPEIQYVEQKPADPIRLFVYTGCDGDFTLYEDENINYNYEHGAFSTISLRYSQKDHILSIGARQGEFPGMLENRTFEIVRIGDGKTGGLDFSGKPDFTVSYEGTAQEIKLF